MGANCNVQTILTFERGVRCATEVLGRIRTVQHHQDAPRLRLNDSVAFESLSLMRGTTWLFPLPNFLVNCRCLPMSFNSQCSLSNITATHQCMIEMPSFSQIMKITKNVPGSKQLKLEGSLCWNRPNLKIRCTLISYSRYLRICVPLWSYPDEDQVCSSKFFSCLLI